MPLAAINPWMFGVVFLAILLVLCLVSKFEKNAAVKPFEKQAKEIGPVRCKRCAAEGPLKVKVKIQLGRTQNEPVPKVDSCTLVCSQCESPEWSPVSGTN